VDLKPVLLYQLFKGQRIGSLRYRRYGDGKARAPELLEKADLMTSRTFIERNSPKDLLMLAVVLKI
jgi:hypothetical protein